MCECLSVLCVCVSGWWCPIYFLVCWSESYVFTFDGVCTGLYIALCVGLYMPTRHQHTLPPCRGPAPDVQRLQAFADGQFDVVYSHQVLEHVPKPWLAGQELVRVLKPGGIGLHTTCAFNPLHGPPVFNDYYRFFPDGLAELFSNVTIHVKAGWGNREALITNLAINDGHGDLGGRRFHPLVGQRNEERYPWHTWIIFQKQGR